jgi:hypothetical protein
LTFFVIITTHPVTSVCFSVANHGSPPPPTAM